MTASIPRGGEAPQTSRTDSPPSLQPSSFGLGPLFWAMHDAVVVTDSRSGRIVLWNPAAEAIFGYSADEAIGMPAVALVPDNIRDEVLQDVETYAQEGHNRLTDSAAPAEFPVLRKSGGEVYVEATVTPIDPATHPGLDGRYLLTISRDVTERRRLQAIQARRVQQSGLRADVAASLGRRGPLRALLQGCAEAMVTHLEAAFARIWTLNESEQMLELEASAGMYTHLDGAHGRVPVGMFKIGLIAQERRPHLTNDVPHDPRVGDKEWARREGMVAFAGYPLLVEDRLVGVMAMFARTTLPDDTLEALASVADAIAQGIERKRAEEALARRAEELARSNADLEQFAYVASHDLQEPLRMVVSYLQLLERRYKEQLDERAERYIDYAVDGARRMQRLINDLLTYSRVGRRGDEVAPVDTEQVLQNAIADLEATIQEAGAAITHDPLPVVGVDRTQVGQLFQNLLSNALRFRGQAPPRVHVSARRQGREWVFSVADNGIGIAPDYFDRIFIIFQRLHGHKAYPGTGIGLAVCKKIVERHGGRIWVESSPGQGATFFFSIPDQSIPDQSIQDQLRAGTEARAGTAAQAE